MRRALIALAALLAGCGPSVERAYTQCAEIAYKQALAGSRSLMQKEASAIFEKAARVQAAERCQFIRDECKRDPQSVDCRSLIEQYGK